MAPRDRERNRPRISVNKLGEYLVASPARRRRIIADQKRPKDFIVAWYTEAQGPITDYLAGRRRDTEALVSAIDSLSGAGGRTEWEEQRNQLCAEAIEAFLDIAEDIDLQGVRVRRGESAPEQLEIAGVSVSVRPETILTRTRRDQNSRGALKLYFAKNNPLDDESGAYVGALIQQYVEESLSEGATVDRSLCLVVDVFAGRVFAAPRSVVRRRRELEAACEEIARAWPAL